MQSQSETLNKRLIQSITFYSKKTLFISFLVGTICFLLLISELSSGNLSYITYLTVTILAICFYTIASQNIKMSRFNDDLINTRREILKVENEWQDRKNFIEAIIHDLKSPMFAEQRALEIIIGKLPMETEILREFLNDIYCTNKEVLRLIENLTLTFKVHRGQYHQDISACSTIDLLEDVFLTIKYLAESKDIHIELLNIRDKPKVDVDYNEVKRAFINIIENAIKFSPKSSSIVISAETVEDFLLLKIEDHGYGIKKEDYYKVFDEYYTTSSKKGSGIGLYISKKIIEANNGTIWFESQENVGTTFYIKLKISHSIEIN